MATKSSSDNDGDHACLMCLDEHDSLKILTNCKHVFCSKCLRTHQKGLGKNSFCCPTCQAACPLPGGDIAALPDYSGDDDDSGTNAKRSKGLGTTLDHTKIFCECCIFTKNLEIDAKNLCEECGNLYLCKDCTEVHGRKKVTAGHAVISLKEHNKGNCKVHRKLINCFCTSCAQPCCRLCVILDHGDHKVEKIGDVFRTLVDELTTITDQQESRSNNLKRFEGQLQYLKSTEVTERRDNLIQATEDQAEKCFAHILQQKDDQIKKIREDYKFVTGVLQSLERVTGLGALDTTVAKAKVLQAEVEIHPEDIRQLSAIKQDILDLGIQEEIDIESYWETYQRFYDNPVQFVPATLQSIGTIQATTAKQWNISQCTSVFEKTMAVDNTAKYIPYVASLGNNFFAIAHPIVAGGRSEAVDIYKFPGEFQRTLKDHVSPLIDMVATFAGQLAILSLGTAEQTCSARLFNPEVGYIRSTKDFAVNDPLSFDVNLCNQYIILSVGNKVTIFNEDGSLALMSTVLSGSGYVSGPCRIRFRGVYIYVMDVNYVFDVYRYKPNEKTMVVYFASSCVMGLSSFVIKDFSVTSFNQIMVCYNYSSYPYCYCHLLVNNQLSNQARRQLGNPAQGANIESRLAVKDKYLVMSQGQTIRVYEEP
ncbi:uncharacterized protein LOC135500739 [Lineus longissimus]|uniref:uncharacterized protein LOC135500739 n=1 Tax=Lineus longissimus TaxID=88925 RepID=UPI00315C63BB